MTHVQFEREKKYRVSLAIAKAMFREGIITEKEYRKIDAMLIAKYYPVIGSL